jgi:hypothetical protein
MIKVLTKIPLLGLFIKDAAFGYPDAKFYFLFNLFFAFLVATYLMGYPFVILSLLIVAFIYLVFLVYFTSTDLIENFYKRKS